MDQNILCSEYNIVKYIIYGKSFFIIFFKVQKQEVLFYEINKATHIYA